MTDTINQTLTIIPCPDCSGIGYGIDCQRCNGSRWIYKPDPVKEEFQITINPMDHALSLRLDRLEEKLDRLLAALDGDA